MKKEAQNEIQAFTQLGGLMVEEVEHITHFDGATLTNYRKVLRSESIPVDQVVTAEIDLVKLLDTQTYAINTFLRTQDGRQLIDHKSCGTMISKAKHKFNVHCMKLLTGAVLD